MIQFFSDLRDQWELNSEWPLGDLGVAPKIHFNKNEKETKDGGKEADYRRKRN